MVEQRIELKTLYEEARELNELYYRRWGIDVRFTQVSDNQPKPKLPLLSRGNDPTLAKHFEDKLNGI